MKKDMAVPRFFLLFIILLFNCQDTVQEMQKGPTIVLVNPSKWSLRSIVYLFNNQIISISNPDLLAVYHAKSENDNITDPKNENRITTAKKYVRDHRIPFIRFMEVEGDLNEKNLYQKNDCTEKFYEIFKQSDGILFFGGADFPPATYGQKTSLLTDIRTPNRHYFELSFLFHLLGGYQDNSFKAFLEENPDYVVYGFCLGMQSMNAAAGGTMVQDIPTDIYGLKYVEDVLALDTHQQHRSYWKNIRIDKDLNGHSFHTIRMLENQFFIEKLKMKDPPLVLSSHHQALKDIGKEFEIAATSLDGKVVEAITHKKYPNVLGVQFHPESMTLYSPEEDPYRFHPEDTLLITEYEFIKNKGSLEFHQNFWQYFSSLYENDSY